MVCIGRWCPDSLLMQATCIRYQQVGNVYYCRYLPVIRFDDDDDDHEDNDDHDDDDQCHCHRRRRRQSIIENSSLWNVSFHSTPG